MTNVSETRALLSRVEELALGTPGVVALHPGPWGEAGTYLPGGMFSGIRVSPEKVQIHITVDYRHDLQQVVAELRQRIAADMGRRVDIVVEDVVLEPDPVNTKTGSTLTDPPAGSSVDSSS